MHIFYTTKIEKEFALLDAVESGHAKRVLRHKVGDSAMVCDGNGILQEAIFTHIHDKECVLKFTARIQRLIKPIQHFHLAFCPTKSADRIEWMLEKCVELGIQEFSPIISQRTEKSKLNIERLEKIMVSAMKQSMQAFIPTINPVLSYKAFITQERIGVVKTIAHCNEGDKQGMKDYINPNFLVCIGPEGDFTEAEVDDAVQHGFSALSLGTQRLRTETAGLYACAQFNTLIA